MVAASDASNSDGHNPLHLSCAGGHAAVVKWLIEGHYIKKKLVENGYGTNQPVSTASLLPLPPPRLPADSQVALGRITTK